MSELAHHGRPRRVPTSVLFAATCAAALWGGGAHGADAVDYPSAVLATPNLLGYWRFTPTSQADSETGDYTGAFQGGAQVAAGGSGPGIVGDSANAALELDGSDDWMTSAGANPLLGQIGSEATILAWFRLGVLPSTTGRIFYIAGQSEGGNDLDLQIHQDDRIYFYTEAGGHTATPVAFDACDVNKWHFVAATLKAGAEGGRVIYLDGVAVATNTPGGHSANSAPFTIGESPVFSSRFFQGRIDEVALFDRALTASEIAAIHALAVAPNNPGTSVYTANFDDSTTSVLRQADIARVVEDVCAFARPQAVAVSTDGSRVYTGNDDGGNGSITVVDGATNAVLRKVSVAAGSTVSDLAATQDGSKVFAALATAGSVVVMDAATFDVSAPFPVPGTGPTPAAIDVSKDGSSIFVLDSAGGRVVKMSAADGAPQGEAALGASGAVRELKVSADGATLVVVGHDAPRFFRTDGLVPVAGASTLDVGEQLDAAAALGEIYVVNQAFVPPPAAATAGPKNGLPSVGASIDVYSAATGAYVKSVPLPAAVTLPQGVAVLSDGSQAFVSYMTATSPGGALAVDLSTGAVVGDGPTGARPRRIAVNEIGSTENIVSFFLPRTMTLKVGNPSDERDSLVGSGYFDDGGVAVDYAAQPVTIEIGDYSRTIQLAPNKRGTVFTFKDATLNFVLTPRFRRASLGLFTFKIAKTPLGALIDRTQPVEFHFRAPGLPDAGGTVRLTDGKYRRGSRRGDIFVPHVFAARVIAKLGGPNKDSLVLRGGFASGGTAPASLGTVRVAFGRQFARTIAGSLFKKSRNADAWTYSSKVGKSSVAITVDFSKDFVSITATNVELGALADETTDFVFDAGDGAGAFRNTIRLSNDANGKARNY